MFDAEAILRELIAIPSVNPAFLPAGDPRAGEKNVVDFLDHWGRRLGLDVDRQLVAPNRENLFIRLSPTSRKPKHRILLAPHTDTVGGPGLENNPFKPISRAGRLYGRGACDTKGCIATMLSALRALSSARRRLTHTEVIFVGLVDEENHQAGSRAFVRARPKFDLAIIGEPTLLQVVTSHKGDLWLRMETHGKAAHGARPELGRNAVMEMARLVMALEVDYAKMLSKRKHPLLGCATVNVGSIQGGRQPNIVPDHCQIQVDRRTLPGELDSRVKRELLEFLRARGLRPKLLDTKGVPSRPMETNPADPMVRRLLEQAGQKKPAGVHFFSDGGVLNAAGIPSVLFGPGSIDQAHTAQEWIELKQLERGGWQLRRFLESLP